jgi:hypothetical protein
VKRIQNSSKAIIQTVLVEKGADHGRRRRNYLDLGCERS